MDSKFNFKHEAIPGALHQALWDAHDAETAKAQHINNLHKGIKDVAADIAATETELKAAKQSYVSGFEAMTEGQEGFPDAAKDAKANITTLTARIQGCRDTLPDFENAISTARKDLNVLRQNRDRARREIVKVILQSVPRNPPRYKDLNNMLSFSEEVATIDLNDAMLLYLAAHESVAGNPFPDYKRNPEQFFMFLSQFFTAPNSEQGNVFRSRFEAVIWGDREPVPHVETPEDELPKEFRPTGDGVFSLST